MIKSIIIKSQNFKRFLSCVLVLSILTLSILSLASCNRSFDEEEVLKASEELLKDAEKLNTIYYGAGINFLSTGRSEGIYFEADPFALDKYGIKTVEDIKTLTSKTFTRGYSSLLFRTVLQPLRDGDSLERVARYVQHYEDLERTKPDYIMVHSNFKTLFDDRMTYDYDSLKVIGSDGDKVKVQIYAQVRDKDSNSQKITINVVLIEENFGWRIDNPVYANYNEFLDKYEDLK